MGCEESPKVHYEGTQMKRCTFVINNVLSLQFNIRGEKRKWAIPEIRCTPPKENMGIPKILTTFFIGKSPKIKHFFGCKGKENMGIPKYSIIFSTKDGNSQFFLKFWHKKFGIPIFKTIFRIPIFKVKIWAWEFPNF